MEIILEEWATQSFISLTSWQLKEPALQTLIIETFCGLLSSSTATCRSEIQDDHRTYQSAIVWQENLSYRKISSCPRIVLSVQVTLIMFYLYIYVLPLSTCEVNCMACGNKNLGVFRLTTYTVTTGLFEFTWNKVNVFVQSALCGLTVNESLW